MPDDLEGQRDRALDGRRVDHATDEPDVGSVMGQGGAEGPAAGTTIDPNTAEGALNRVLLVGATAEPADLGDRAAHEGARDGGRPATNKCVEPERAPRDGRRVVTQILMLDVDIPGAVIAARGRADELSLGIGGVG